MKTKKTKGSFLFLNRSLYFWNIWIINITNPTTPVEASVSNNATSVSSDGKTLTWDFKYGQENRVQFAFSFPGENGAVNNSEGGIMGFIKDNMLIVGAGAIFLLIVIWEYRRHYLVFLS